MCLPQESIYYALGRLSVLQKNALDQSKLERLMQTPTLAEAAKTLSEIGWADDADYEKMAADHFRKACEITRAIATNEKLVDCFLLRYDVSNLKMLLKARCLNLQSETLSPCGTYPVDFLRHAVSEHQYSRLHPALADAMNALEKKLALNPDPFEIDVTLDKALYETIFALLPRDEKTARDYFTAKVDIVNLMMTLRVYHMGKSAEFLSQLLLDHGTISKSTWIKTFEKPEKLPLLVNKYGLRVYKAAITAQMTPGKLAQLECAMDNYLLSVYTPYRREMDKAERIIGYLLMRERESAAVRLIMAGKANGFSPDTIRERLRELYGR